ncbi:MAG: hypothetical protein RL660_1999 [Bacteroidota bacterium]|jgi:hypothetical protein
MLLQRLIAALGLCAFAVNISAQNVPIGTWTSLLSYDECAAVCPTPTHIYSGKYGLLQYDKGSDVFSTFSKVNGLSSSDIVHISYNSEADALFIGYSNADIDLYRDGNFTNLPDLKIANVSGSKGINGSAQLGKQTIVATDAGIMFINHERQEIATSFPFVVAGSQAFVSQVLVHNDSIYANTSLGVYRISAQDQFPEEITRWQKLGSTVFGKITFGTNTIFASTINRVFSIDPTWQTATEIRVSAKNIVDLKARGDSVYVVSFSENTGSDIHILNVAGSELNFIGGTAATKIEFDPTNARIWCADVFVGCLLIDVDNSKSLYIVNGPRRSGAFKLRYLNNKLYAASGGVDGAFNPLGNRSGLNVFDDGQWKNYSTFSGYPTMDSAADILDIAYDAKAKKIYAPSYNYGGLLEFDEQDNIKIYKYGSGLDPAQGGEPSRFNCSNTAIDNKGTLWVSLAYVSNNLVAKDKDNNWYRFALPNNGSSNVIGEIIVDQANQKWVILPRGQGLAVYNDNGTLGNKADDKSMVYKSGNGSGNLASNTVLSACLDRDGKLWVGTSDGVSIINCPESALESGGCEAENKIVKYDIKADKLFISENVRAIAVDGGNRKWVGTDNGLWLVSADAQQLIQRFNINNSPLPSNEITSIAIDDATGIVYIGTKLGILSYRSDATASANPAEDLLIFPNPVKENYSGTITINGLVQDAEVHIIDAAGQLVYKGKANGGTFSWNGKTYLGAKPQSGVYMVLASNADGSVKQRGTFTFLH